MTKQVTNDVTDNESINRAKIDRNRGILTPEVVAMDNAKLDEMVGYVKKACASLLPKNLDECVEVLKNDQDLLAKFCMFADAYDDILKWNKSVPFEMTKSHREMDIALVRSVWDSHDHKYADAIAFILYNYAHRN